MSGPFVWARSSAAPDESFDELVGLADCIQGAREKVGVEARLRFISADVWRGQDPVGAAVAVRLDDGRERGRGSLLGYAFLGGVERPARRLFEAVQRARGTAAAA